MAQTSTPSTTTTPQTAAEAASRRLKMILILAAVALYWASMYFYVPTLPVYVEDKTQDLVIVGTVLSMYGLWQAIVRLPLGIAADWLGKRKPFLIVGFALSALGAWLMATSDGTNGLIVGRAITGLAAATWVPLTVMFSSLFPANEAVRATAILSLVNSLSRVIATGMNGALNEAGGYSLAFFLAAGVAGLAILVTLPVREQARAPKRPSPRSIGILITRRDVLLPALLSAVAQYVAWATTFGFVPVLARNLGANDMLQSALVSMNLALSMVGNLLLSTIVKRIGNLRLLYIGFALTCTGIVLAGTAGSLPVVFIAQALIGLGAGVSYPLLMGMSIEKVSDSERTTAMGLHQAVYAIGMFAGPWLSGILADSIGIQPMFMITGVVCFALVIVGARFLKR